MNAVVPFIGIDFGTSNSKMAWYNPKANEAQIILNREGQSETPSVVYFGKDQTLVGSPAVEMLDYEQERGRIIMSIKRELGTTPVLALPGKSVTPVEVAAEILRKLKRDAEDLHFLQEVTHAVITCPASFGPLERDKLREAASLAGLAEIELLEEPVAAALAYAQMGLKVGTYVLVYDLGGGTFDLAVLVREEDGTFRSALEPQGIKRCGGDDFDEALYNYCDTIAKERYGRPISLTEKRDLHFLHECRHRKENLSTAERRLFKSLLEPGAVLFQYEIDRTTFENLINITIEETMRKTIALLEQAHAEGYVVDTVVLVGGSTRVPLIQRLLTTQLPVKPIPWHQRDAAVALGAAYHAQSLWKPENRYRRALVAVWAGRKLDQTTVTQLATLAHSLGLAEQEVATLERKVMGETKEKVFARQEAWEDYRVEVQAVWRDKRLDETKLEHLVAFATKLGLSENEVASIEREVMGDAKQTLFARQMALERYRTAVAAMWDAKGMEQAKLEQFTALANELDLSREQVAELEREVMGETKEAIVARQEQYRTAVEAAWADKKLERKHMFQLYALADELSLNDKQVNSIERQVLGDIKEGVFARHYKPVVSPPVGISELGKAVEATKPHPVKPSATLKPEEFALLRTLSGHAGPIHSVAFSPDGQTLASGSRDTTIKLWNVQTGQTLLTLNGHTDWVNSVAINPDGQMLASGSRDTTIKLWNVQTVQELRTLSRHTGSVLSVAFSSDRQTLASGSGDQTIKLWNVQSGQVMRTLRGHTSEVLSVAFSADGQTLASGSVDQTIKLWNVQSGQVLRTLRGHTSEVLSVAFSADGQTLASGSQDQTIKLWHVQGGQVLRTLRGHTSYVWNVAFSPDGQLLASGSHDKTIKVWNVQSGQVLRTLNGHANAVYSVAFSLDGQTLASGSQDQTIKIWEKR